MTPGDYIRRRREAGGHSIEDLAVILPVNSHVASLSHAAYLRAVEGNALPITLSAAVAIQRDLAFDFDVLIALVASEDSGISTDTGICRICACSEWDPCDLPGGETCAWAAPDLCTACVAKAAPESQPEPSA